MKHLQHIVLFDGVCNLCNSAVQFVIRHDREAIFKFAALQSEAGQKLLKQYHLPASDFESFVYINNSKAYRRSTAAIKVAQALGNGWKLFATLLIFPEFIRDPFYNLIANSRYKIFGRKESCMIPTPELRSRFLNAEEI